MSMRYVSSAFVIAVSLVAVVSAQKPGASQSAAPAKELLGLMSKARLDSFAARDSGEPGRYVAAINLAGVELLVASAKADPAELEYRLGQKDYRTAYSDLNTSLSSSAKVLIEDQKGDGLVMTPPRNSTTFDSIADDGGKPFAFDNDTRAHKMSSEEYQKKFEAADATYAHMLGVLLAELKKAS